MRAAIYARVSTDEQAKHGTSLASQVDRCVAYATGHGWDVVADGEREAFIDEGVSGAKASRPALDRLMAVCRAGAVDTVVVTKVDRFARSTRNLLNAVEELVGLDVAFVALDDPIDLTTAFGKAAFEMRGVFASLERSLITERMLGGLRATATQGNWPGGPPPYGLKLAPKDEGQRRRSLELHPTEAHTVVTAASMIIDQGMSTWETAAALNALGLPPRKARRWDHVNLRRVLSQTHYSGTAVWSKQSARWGRSGPPIEIEVPAVLTEERHRELLLAIGATSSGPKTAAQVYALSGRLIGVCGSPFHGVYRKDRDCRQYRCRNARPEAEHRCDDHRLNADRVEALVWGEVTDLLSQPERLIAMAEEYLGVRGAEVEVERDQLGVIDRKIADLESAVATAAVQCLKAGLDAVAITQATDQLNDELVALRAHRKQLAEWQADTAGRSDRMRRLWELADVAHDRLRSMTRTERKAVIDLLDINVTIKEWVDCETCGGKGRVRTGVSGGSPCPACAGARRSATLLIEGSIHDSLIDAVGELSDGASRRSTCCRR